MGTNIIVPNMRKGQNPGAWRGPLTCPHIDFAGNVCGAQKWKYVSRVSPYRIRYMCKKCGRTTQYDYSNNLEHPYAVFGKSKYRQIVEAARNRKGKRP
jgi:hypothetical protein